MYVLAGALGTGFAARAQQAGPPAYVPVPGAPIASDLPKPEPAVPVPSNDLHFRLRLLDGRTSLPLKTARIRLWYNEREGNGYLLTTDQHGEVLLPAPPQRRSACWLHPKLCTTAGSFRNARRCRGITFSRLRARGFSSKTTVIVAPGL